MRPTLTRPMTATACVALVCSCFLAAAFVRAEESVGETSNAFYQATYVWQAKDAFAAAYTGPNSLTPGHEKSYSFTATAFWGWRVWQGGEFYFNPEAAQGVPLSGLLGLGGFTNGEIARTSGATLTFYRARLFLRQTWDVSAANEQVESAPNQLAGSVASQRWVFTLGNLAVTDIFDTNQYNHDPRTQFLNWSLMTQGAYDFAADARGYSWGAALEWYHDDWALRAGRFIQPKQPDMLPLDPAIFRHYGDQLELERRHEIAGLPGKLRLLLFRNRAVMSRFRQATELGLATHAVPDIDKVRFTEQTKTGFGLNLEQALGDDLGLFARASHADGKTETYAFAEIDDSLSAGVQLKGSAWQRNNDSVGLAVVRNGLSHERRDYLAAGGLSFFIGDGRLDYRPEAIVEAFYNVALAKGVALTFDWQRIDHPAYNAARGPVDFLALRLHLEF